MTEENWKEKLMEFQMLQQQAEQIAEHIQMLQQKQAELDISINAVKELGSTEAGTEVLAPIANGIFFKADLKDNQKLIVNVGSDTTVEKTVDEVVGLLEKQQEKMKEKVAEAEQVMEQVHGKLTAIYEIVKEAE